MTTSSVVNFALSDACLSKDNVNPGVIEAFEALPSIASPAQESPEWQAYGSFLKKYGSHVQVSQQIGSRLRHWVSSTSTAVSSATTLEAKACAEVEGITSSGSGWAVSGCSAYSESDKEKAMKVETTDLQTVSGGTASTRAAVMKDLNPATLSAFIDSADQGTQAVGYSYKPLHVLLQQLYSKECQQAPKGTACAHVQRAVNLQAYYDGILALRCPTLKNNAVTYQFFGRTDASSLGIRTYFCQAAKEGCTSDADCHLGGAGSVCYCYGDGCVDHASATITGTAMHRPTIRGNQSGSYDSGVNNACYYKFIAHCNCDDQWAGGLPKRQLYTQAAPAVSVLFASMAGGTRRYTELRQHSLHNRIEPRNEHVLRASATSAADAALLGLEDNPLLDLINSLIKQLLPEIDAEIPSLIESVHLDPMASVTSGKADAGSVNLGICHATAYAEYSVTNLVGLKGLRFTDLQLTAVTAENETIVATGVYHIAEKSPLSADVGGSATAKCGFIHPSVGLSGTATVDGAQVYGTVTVKGVVKVVGGTIKPQITALNFDTLDASVASASVHLHSLGIFAPLADAIASLIATALKGPIVDALDGPLKSALQDAVNKLLPIPKSASGRLTTEPDSCPGRRTSPRSLQQG